MVVIIIIKENIKCGSVLYMVRNIKRYRKAVVLYNREVNYRVNFVNFIKFFSNIIKPKYMLFVSRTCV